MLKLRFLLIFAVFALALVGCAGPLQVVKQAEPNPLLGTRRFIVLPASFDGVDIVGKTEAEYLATQEPDSQASFADDKAGQSRGFATALEAEGPMKHVSVEAVEKPNGKDHQIVPFVVFLEPGYWGGVGKAVVKIRVEIRDPNGALIDEVVVRGDSHKADAGRQAVLGPVAGVLDAADASKTGERRARMVKAAISAANVLVDYLAERTRE